MISFWHFWNRTVHPKPWPDLIVCEHLDWMFGIESNNEEQQCSGEENKGSRNKRDDTKWTRDTVQHMLTEKRSIQTTSQMNEPVQLNQDLFPNNRTLLHQHSRYDICIAAIHNKGLLRKGPILQQNSFCRKWCLFLRPNNHRSHPCWFARQSNLDNVRYSSWCGNNERRWL